MDDDNPQGAPVAADAPPEYEGPTSDEKTWAMIAHLSAFAGYVIPFGNVIGPLIVWLVKKDEYPLVDDQGRESLNFQITMSIALLISIPLVFVLIGILLLIVLPIVNIVLIIIGAIKASSGDPYRYPFCIRLVR